jgi:hypothetical protein
MSMTHLDLMRDATRAFPPVADPASIRSARIWHCKYRTLAPLAGLSNLEELVVAGFPDASFELLAGLGKLRFLSIMHMPLISDIAPLANLRQLTSLSLATLPGWDAAGKRTMIRSLEPLTAIPALAQLELIGILPPDKSLRPLQQCRHLRTARIAHYPRSETDRFFAETEVLCEFNPAPSFA